MNNFSKTTFIFICLLLSQYSTGQDVAIEGVKFSSFEGISDIDDVGYYAVYEQEKQNGN